MPYYEEGPAVLQPPRPSPTPYQYQPNLLQNYFAGQNAATQSQLAYTGAQGLLTSEGYDLEEKNLREQQDLLTRQLAVRGADIGIQQRAVQRQRPLMGTLADLQRREFDIASGALQRQMGNLDQQYTLEQQLWGLEREELGDEREQDVYAAMRARQKAESEAVVRGALESIGHGRNLEDISKQLAWELADIDRRLGAQDIKEKKFKLNFDEERARLQDQYNQINEVDRWKYYYQYHEELAKLDDQEAQLALMAEENNISQEEVLQKIQYGLDKLGLSRKISALEVAEAQAKIRRGEFSTLGDLLPLIYSAGGLNLGSGARSGPGGSPSGSLTTSIGGYQVDSGLAPQFNYISSQFGLQQTSGYRTQEQNSAAGGVENSAHLSGRAMDYVGTPEQMEAGRQWALANGASEAIIHDAGSGTHLHVEW